MINSNDINNRKPLSNTENRAFEKKMQQDELSYLSSVAFEQFSVSQDDIEALKKRIDKKSMPNWNQFNTIFISVLCGLLIGVSIFFVIFNKSKIHPSVYQKFQEEELANHQTNPSINATDTVFPILKQTTTQKTVEHFNLNENTVVEQNDLESLETLPKKTSPTGFAEADDNQELILQFIPNAPVVFISNMKVANYKLYYFKLNEGINLTINTGVSAQYENRLTIENSSLPKNSAYFAHKIIQKAMRLFDNKDYVASTDELTLLYKFNKDDANAQFYLGLCYFQLGKFSIAQSFFNKNADNSINIFHQESAFYEALCFINLNQAELAKTQLQRIVSNKGFYADRARETLLKL